MFYGIDSNSNSTTVAAAAPTLASTPVPDWVWSNAAKDSAAANVSYVARYLTGHGTANLSITEVLALSDAGLRVVSIFETSADISIFTEANGYAHGNAAWAAAARVSQSMGTPVYFTVDTSPTPDQLPLVGAYFEGVRRSLNDYNSAQNSTSDIYSIGVYGQPHVCTYCRDTDSTTSPGLKLASWFWRWGGFGDWAGASMRQLYGENYYSDRDPSLHYIGSTGHVIGEKFCGLSVDFDISEVDSLDQVGAWFIPPPSNE